VTRRPGVLHAGGVVEEQIRSDWFEHNLQASAMSPHNVKSNYEAKVTRFAGGS
jgi:hypothetical protein